MQGTDHPSHERWPRYTEQHKGIHPPSSQAYDDDGIETTR
ncbi:predicted protein [Plenodomus lingam JN3]|uniref:Predicted protein n=1 Tax=Leptosphaeria maculans (strain JN3 / isolate v23.1.3 / race Av1-4-5-6-7-8) TaxID=985895 RepID=E4ZPK1_LEPMJ|nr:predicted protein [Plenodomus lingam JN3]CBX93226.1 predicted protein [Plenodomus lingam JN3]